MTETRSLKTPHIIFVRITFMDYLEGNKVDGKKIYDSESFNVYDQERGLLNEQGTDCFNAWK